jgi:hypothetical protein
MNIITSSDVDKFLKLLKAGLKDGRKKELKEYTSATTFDGTSVVKEYYVSLEFRFMIDREFIDNMFIEDNFDVSSQVDDLLK